MHTLRSLQAFIAPVLLMGVTSGILSCTAEVRQYGTGGAGGAGGSGGSSTSGGMQCSTDTECGASSECQSFGCVDGSCKVSFAVMGTQVAVQASGDCQASVCDGNGYIINVTELSDPVDDGNPCTLDACIGTETQHGFLAAGTSCESTRFCDGFGACVECLESSQCPSGVCTMNECAPAMCTDVVMNGSETDVDCGGSQCPTCAPGGMCLSDMDCKSQVCFTGVCAESTCQDGVANGMETDIDCGGPGCSPCAVDRHCNAGLDCTSKVCLAGTCVAPTCIDKVTNGNETDVDCGGGMCAKCLVGKACLKSPDCASGNCCTPEPGFPGYCEKALQACVLLLRSEMPE